MQNYNWIVEQLKLIENPIAKLNKVAELIVQQEGNESEKHGLPFGLIPQWAREKAEHLLHQAIKE